MVGGKIIGMKKLLLLFLNSLFLFSCANENSYDCTMISHENEIFKACKPKLNSTCTTNSGQDGNFYYLHKCPYEESWNNNSTKLALESICLSNKDFKQKEAQYTMILTPNKTICLGRKSDGRNNKEKKIIPI